MKKLFFFTLVISSIFLVGCTQQQPQDIELSESDQASPAQPTELPINNVSGETMKTLDDFEPITASQATIVTNKGSITFDLYQEQAPITVANFLNLAKSGFYEGIKFHRIIPDFMAQVGDPLTKDDSKEQLWGTGGPGYTIPDEFDASLKHDSEGTVSMANSGPDTGGSQIFITYEPTPWLDGKHTIFGKVTEGMDVLRSLEIGDTIEKVTYQ